MKKILTLLLAALLLASPVLASAAPVVSDAAGVLSPGLISGIQALGREMENKLDIRLRVLTRDFLGGAQATAFTEETRLSSDNPDQTLLLVMVIGEERYAVSMGSVPGRLISRDTANHLLANAFRAPFLKRNYDEALQSFLYLLMDRVENASGQRLDSKRLFNGAQPAPAPAPTREQNPLDSFFKKWEQSADNARRYEEDAQDAGRSRSSLSLWQIALIGFILFKLFGRNRATGKKRGCGPLGWIFGTWGISKFFGWRK